MGRVGCEYCASEWQSECLMKGDFHVVSVVANVVCSGVFPLSTKVRKGQAHAVCYRLRCMNPKYATTPMMAAKNTMVNMMQHLCIKARFPMRRNTLLASTVNPLVSLTLLCASKRVSFWTAMSTRIESPILSVCPNSRRDCSKVDVL